MFTKIGRKCIENGKIFPEDGASSDYFGNSVALLVITSIFATPDGVEVNDGSVYFVDICVPPFSTL